MPNRIIKTNARWLDESSTGAIAIPHAMTDESEKVKASVLDAVIAILTRIHKRSYGCYRNRYITNPALERPVIFNQKIIKIFSFRSQINKAIILLCFLTLYSFLFFAVIYVF